MKEATYNVEIKLTKDGKKLTLKGTVSFAHNEGDYGNGYWMGIEGLDEPSIDGVYDIRYDMDFDPDCMIEYITKLYSFRFSGKEHKWKMTSISVEEVEES